VCAIDEPLLRELRPGQFAACHFPIEPEEGWESSLAIGGVVIPHASAGAEGLPGDAHEQP
jgi:hypothetical protein